MKPIEQLSGWRLSLLGCVSGLYIAVVLAVGYGPFYQWNTRAMFAFEVLNAFSCLLGIYLALLSFGVFVQGLVTVGLVLPLLWSARNLLDSGLYDSAFVPSSIHLTLTALISFAIVSRFANGSRKQTSLRGFLISMVGGFLILIGMDSVFPAGELRVLGSGLSLSVFAASCHDAAAGVGLTWWVTRPAVTMRKLGKDLGRRLPVVTSLISEWLVGVISTFVLVVAVLSIFGFVLPPASDWEAPPTRPILLFGWSQSLLGWQKSIFMITVLLCLAPIVGWGTRFPFGSSDGQPNSSVEPN